MYICWLKYNEFHSKSVRLEAAKSTFHRNNHVFISAATHTAFPVATVNTVNYAGDAQRN